MRQRRIQWGKSYTLRIKDPLKKLMSSADLQFLIDIGYMLFYGRHTDLTLLHDFRIAEAVYQILEHFVFPEGQVIGFFDGKKDIVDDGGIVVNTAGEGLVRIVVADVDVIGLIFQVDFTVGFQSFRHFGSASGRDFLL